MKWQRKSTGFFQERLYLKRKQQQRRRRNSKKKDVGRKPKPREPRCRCAGMGEKAQRWVGGIPFGWKRGEKGNGGMRKTYSDFFRQKEGEKNSNAVLNPEKRKGNKFTNLKRRGNTQGKRRSCRLPEGGGHVPTRCKKKRTWSLDDNYLKGKSATVREKWELHSHPKKKHDRCWPRGNACGKKKCKIV